jgi:integrase/recombinase XerD
MSVEGCGNGEYYFWSGIGNPKSCVADWQRSLTRLGKLAGVKFHADQLRDSFAIGLLTNGVSLETVAVLLGNSLKVCERHYNPWVMGRQNRLEEAIRRTFAA